MICSVVLFTCIASSVSSASVKRDADKYQVIIVGAGISGFTAAATLLEHNVTDLLILEASDRIGGRIHTMEFGDVPIDKGAEFVHGEVDNAVYELVSDYNLLASYSTLLQPEKFLFANTSGHVFNSTFVKGVIDEASGILGEDGTKHFNGSLGDYFFPRLYIHTQNLDAQLRESIHHLFPLLEGVYSAADDLSQIGARGNTEYWENEGDLILKWKVGGYKTIFDFISKKFYDAENELPVRNKTVLGKNVIRIERGEGDVEIKCADGSNYIADHVIVTPSLGVLKKHAATWFHPALPADKTAVIEVLGFGSVGKVFMLFPDRWWTNDTNVIIPLFSKQALEDYKANSAHGSWVTYTTGFHPVMNHERMLCAWFSGQACRTMETLTEEQIIDGLMELLDMIVGSRFNISRPESILRTNWASNPYTMGSYSFRTVASDQRNLNNTHLGQPILGANDKPVILFAGEATHPHYFSTVHGALASGRREAERLIDYVNSHSKDI